MTGRLILVPNTLDLGTEAVDLRQTLPDSVLQTAARLEHWVVEDARSTRSFLKRVSAHVPLAQPLQALQIVELPRPRKGSGDSTPASAWRELLQPALAGHDMGLLSEAGLPAVADPGAELVRAAHAAGVVVQTLAGPSSLLMAVAASGLNGQSFAFVGYLPQEATERTARLRALEATSRREKQTQLMIETPYRSAALLGAMLTALSPSTRVSVSCGLTLPTAWTRSDTVAAWRETPTSMPDKVPAVFCLLAS